MKIQKSAVIIIIGLIILGIVIYFVLGKVQEMEIMKAEGEATREGFNEAKNLLGNFTPQQ